MCWGENERSVSKDSAKSSPITSPRWLICWKTLIHTTPAFDIDQTKHFIHIYFVRLNRAKGSNRMLGRNMSPRWINRKKYMIIFAKPFGLFYYILFNIETELDIIWAFAFICINVISARGTCNNGFLLALIKWVDFNAISADEAIPTGKNTRFLNIVEEEFFWLYIIFNWVFFCSVKIVN